MKILIISDSHRKDTNVERVLEKIGPIDRLIHLGDAEGSEDYLQEIADCPIEVVAGNNDFFTRLDRERVLKIGNYRIWLTHGHYYYVAMGTSVLRREACARGMDIVMFGHTHKPMLEVGDGLIMLNPGSISYPRQAGRKPSYIIMNVDDLGEAEFELCYLDE